MNVQPIERLDQTKILSRIVKHGQVAYFAGVTAPDKSAGMRGQTEQVVKRLEDQLAKVGSDKSRLLTAMIFVSDLTLRDEMNEVWTSWLNADELPTRATVAVADLGPNTLLEVVVTAAI